MNVLFKMVREAKEEKEEKMAVEVMEATGVKEVHLELLI